MTIPNYDFEIEKRGHPENFEPRPGDPVIPGGSTIRVVRIKKSAKRGSAKEARSIAHKKLNQI
jgi:hypothetical protein